MSDICFHCDRRTYVSADGERRNLDGSAFCDANLDRLKHETTREAFKDAPESPWQSTGYEGDELAAWDTGWQSGYERGYAQALADIRELQEAASLQVIREIRYGIHRN